MKHDPDVFGILLVHLIKHRGQPGAVRTLKVGKQCQGNRRIGRALGRGLRRCEFMLQVHPDGLNALVGGIRHQENVIAGAARDALRPCRNRYRAFQGSFLRVDMKAGVVGQHVNPAAVFGYGHIHWGGIHSDVTKNFQIDFGAAGLPQNDTNQGQQTGTDVSSS